MSMSKMARADSNSEKENSLLLILFGITLLTISLVTSARLGVYQEVVFTKYGKQSREAVFYNHFLPLPFFTILAPSIIENVRILNSSLMHPVPIITDLYAFVSGDYESAVAVTSLPILWQYMIGNLITQYVCISSVFYLTSVCTSLTVTLLMTLRKFVSLIISVFYFKNDFTLLHWCGAAFVFMGTLIYAEIFSFLFKESKTEISSYNGFRAELNNENQKKLD